jgi:hypothetical protein
MNDLATLHDELLIGHPVTGAYSADAATAAEQINALNRSRLVPITSGELLAWSGAKSDGDRPRIIKIEEGEASAVEDVAAICKVAAETIRRDGTELDLNRADRVAMVTALVAAGVLSQADSDSLYSLATQAISRATEIGLSNVRAGTVEQARALTPSPQQGVI